MTSEKAGEKCKNDESAPEEMKNNSNESTPVPKQMEMSHNESNCEEMETSNNPISGGENSTDEPSFDTTVNVQNKKFHDVVVQVKSDNFMFRFKQFIENDSQLSTATRIQSFDILNCIVKLASTIYTDKSENTVKMALQDKIVMTYEKLKQNVSYSFLALLFKVYTPEHCAHVFKDTILLLSSCLEVAIT